MEEAAIVDSSMTLPSGVISSRKTTVAGSRDEMNLAEFPLTVLSTRANPSLKTLEFCDSVRGKNGELLERRWIITGADKFGLPTASDDEVLLGLLKLSVEDGFKDRKVYFTRYELLRILRWTTEGRSYVRLQKALDRLSGVRIKATNAFYDNESKSHSTRNFGIIDAYEINDGRNTDPKPSFFTWSDVLFKSFQVGFIKKLDLDFYLGLQSAVSKRLYRYLDKHFWYKTKVHINLFTLAHEKIGISRNYAYASSLRQQLDPAVEELIAQKFLAGCEYVGKGKDTEIILYAAGGKPRSKPASLSDATQTGESNDQDLQSRVRALLVERGIRANQVDRLLTDKSSDEFHRMLEIVEYFDQLRSSSHGKRMSSPVGFLYRAIERAQEFILPKKDTPRQESLRLSGKSKAEPSSQADLQRSRYLVDRKRQIERCRQEIEPALLKGLRADVEKALVKLRTLISPERFTEAVEHGVEEKLLSLFGFPNFESWERENSRPRS